MTTSESEDNHLREVLNQALDAIDAGRRQHIYRRCQQTSNTVIWHFDRDLEKLNACCPDFEITTEEDYWGIIIDCLETALEDPVAITNNHREKSAITLKPTAWKCSLSSSNSKISPETSIPNFA